jgi:hypothetical protein
VRDLTPTEGGAGRFVDLILFSTWADPSKEQRIHEMYARLHHQAVKHVRSVTSLREEGTMHSCPTQVNVCWNEREASTIMPLTISPSPCFDVHLSNASSYLWVFAYRIRTRTAVSLSRDCALNSHGFEPTQESGMARHARINND